MPPEKIVSLLIEAQVAFNNCQVSLFEAEYVLARARENLSAVGAILKKHKEQLPSRDGTRRE